MAAHSTHVAIFLCTHQGERFLPRQLDSVAAQTHTDWRIWAADDHSTDGTLDVLQHYRTQWGENKLAWVRGPGRGFVANFLTLACTPEINSAYYAFCDQDDLWDPDKLDVALAWVTSIPAHIPAVYGARTRLIDEDDGVIGLSPLFPHPMSFANAIVQSVAGGNTMVFNHAARALLMEAGPDLDIQTHDWWLYILTTGCGGLLHYDPVPKVGYRQHPNNIVGSNIGWMPRLRRAYRLLIGRFRSMNDRNFAALRRMRHRMSPEALAVLDEFERARHAWLLPRIIGIRKSGVYLQDHHRQSRPDCRDPAQEAVSPGGLPPCSSRGKVGGGGTALQLAWPALAGLTTTFYQSKARNRGLCALESGGCLLMAWLGFDACLRSILRGQQP
jgi:glycosyltransferase involved in cell wall biosynthesis